MTDPREVGEVAQPPTVPPPAGRFACRACGCIDMPVIQTPIGFIAWLHPAGAGTCKGVYEPVTWVPDPDPPAPPLSPVERTLAAYRSGEPTGPYGTELPDTELPDTGSVS